MELRERDLAHKLVGEQVVADTVWNGGRGRGLPNIQKKETSSAYIYGPVLERPKCTSLAITNLWACGWLFIPCHRIVSIARLIRVQPRHYKYSRRWNTLPSLQYKPPSEFRLCWCTYKHESKTVLCKKSVVAYQWNKGKQRFLPLDEENITSWCFQFLAVPLPHQKK